MIVYALDTAYNTLEALDAYIELIWTERYRTYGDFELYLPVSFCADTVNLAKGNYLCLPESDRYMIIEDSTTDVKFSNNKPCYKLVGRSLESILDRRIIWKQIDYSGTIHNLVKRILTENIISPSNSARRIPNFTFEDSSGGRMGETVSNIELHGENVLDIIEDICASYDLGYKITPTANGGFKFKLYAGVDRSYTQNTNPWVVFSPKYENISETQLLEKMSKYKNTACVYNEYTRSIYNSVSEENEEETIRSEVEVYNKLGAVSGLARKEVYVSSSASHNRNDGSDTPYSTSEYRNILVEEGKKELSEHAMTSAFTGKLEPYRQFVLGRDFDLGDIVSIENQYGQKGRCRVIEVIRSSSSSGENILPAFENADYDKIVT